MSDEISSRLTEEIMASLRRHTPGILQGRPRDTAIAISAISTAEAAILAAVKLVEGEQACSALREYMRVKVAAAVDEILQKATLHALRKPAGPSGKN